MQNMCKPSGMLNTNKTLPYFAKWQRYSFFPKKDNFSRFFQEKLFRFLYNNDKRDA